MDKGEGLYKINPVLVDNTLFAASAEGDVAAVDAETGRVRWKRDMDPGVVRWSGALRWIYICGCIRRAGNEIVRGQRG
jgi:outer membrane protein assembly factor BamB